MSRVAWAAVVFVSFVPSTLTLGSPAYDPPTGVEDHVVQIAVLSNPALEPDASFDRPCIYGDSVVIGAPADDLEGLGLTDAGSAHVYLRDGDRWHHLQTLTAPDAEEGQAFGGSLALWEDTLVVGAPGPWWCSASQGAAYVYRRVDGQWEFEQKLTAALPERAIHFGDYVDVHENTIVIGVRADGSPWPTSKACVFRRGSGGWVQEQVLELPTAPTHTQQAMRVSVFGDRVAISSTVDDDDGFEYVGAVHVFVRDNGAWVLEQSLRSPEPADGTEFGWSLDLEGDRLIVGAHWTDHSGLDGAGAAYIFSREGGTWILEARLTSTAPVDRDAFGFSVALADDIALVGTSGPYRQPDSITNSLHIYTRRGESWKLQRVIRGQELAVGWIAWSIAVHEGVIAMGAWSPDEGVPSIRLFEVRPGPDRLVLPVVARAQGAGAFFTSRWDLHNAGDTAMTIEMTYTPRADMGGARATVSHALPADSLEEILDPLHAIFGLTESAVGSVTMEVVDGSVFELKAQSVIFASLPDGSEFGQFFPASLISAGMPAGHTAYLTTTENADRNRVNFGLVAVEDDTRVSLTAVDPLDTALAAERTFDLDAGESAQVNRVNRELGLGEVSDYQLKVEVESGCALAYTSILDGNGSYTGTSDPTTVLPTSTGAVQLVLLELGSVQGIDEFSGSATIANLSPSACTVRADFYQRGSSGIAASTTIDLEAGDTVGFGDAVGELFGLDNAVGTVVLTPTAGCLISAVGREFAIYRDGGGEIVGTAGQLMAGMGYGDLFLPGVTYQFIGLRSLVVGDAIERSHLAIFNPLEQELQATFATFNERGEQEGSIMRTIPGRTLEHLNHILDLVDPDQDGRPKRLQVTVDAAAWVRVFRVNPTGDPITLEPFVH